MRKIWWIRAMLIVFLALFIAGSVLAGELKNIIKKFTCNNIEITVLSQVSDEGDIQLQRIIFTDRTNMRKIKEINNKDYPLVEISCLKSTIDNKHYFEFYYTTGGSCVQCEYFELYSEHGKLIASDKEKIYLKIIEDKMGRILPKNEAIKLDRIFKKYRDEITKLKLKEEDKIWIKED